MPVLIENLQEKVEVTEDMLQLINSAVKGALDSEGFETPSEISILLVDDLRIHEMNKEHRNVDRPTDVLSFPMVDMEEGRIVSNLGDYDLDEDLLILGDIVISLETAKRQALEYQHSFYRELAFLTTHGAYHLLGYDHETPKQEKTMLGKQEAVLKQMSLSRESYFEDDKLNEEQKFD